jgi:membrane fusion protein, multidrug efflux system
VTFALPENQLSEVKKYMAQEKVKVLASVPNETTPPEMGVLTFTDNAVDLTTGTIKLKGTFANTERKLWPGQFVRVALRLTTQPNAVLVASRAVQTGQEGKFVFVVKPDMTVESRPVVVGRRVDQDFVIEKGLQPGETVVTDGQLRLAPGVHVQAKNEQGT